MAQFNLTNTLTIKQILLYSWKIYKNNFLLICTIIIIVYLPINIALSFIPQGDLSENTGQFMHHLRYRTYIEGLFGIISVIAIAFINKSVIDKHSLNIKSIFKKSISKWPAAVGTQILLSLWVGLYFLLIIPGIIYLIYWIFAFYVAIFKGVYFKEAMNYSKKIVKGRWPEVFFYSLVFGLLFVLTAFLCGVVVAIPKVILGNNILLTLISNTAGKIATSYFVIVFVIFFINFDNTKEEKISD
jgi:hypothetical protein